MAFQFSDDRWLALATPGVRCRRRLVVFPYAGGGASAYFGWQSHLPEDWQLVCVQLPGRENRYSEPVAESIDAVTEQLAAVIVGLLDLPVVVFGHSMGGWLAWESLRRLRPSLRPMVRRLVVAASPAPTVPRHRDDWLHDLPQAELIEKIRELGGTPETVFRHREMLDLVLPVLRADLRLFETHVPASDPPVSCPIAALAASADPQVAPRQMAGWQSLTTGPFDLQIVEGGHFFPREHPQLVLPAILAP